MPLVKGSSPEIISQNIGELIRSGHEASQAAAIAYKYARGEDSAAGVMHRYGEQVLLLLRAPTSGDFPLHWALPGGLIEEGETPEQAAIRECQEEIGHSPIAPLYVLDYDGGFTTFGLNLEAPIVPALNEEHAGYMWAPMIALPSPMHPGVAATLAALPSLGVALDARELDGNGWVEFKANPISKAGIFPYSGRQLGLTGPDADRIFQVLRPPEELADPECIESFKLVPWIDNHVMLGPVAQEMTDRALPAERKGVDGVIGEQVFYKDGTLFANIKAFSSSLAALIAAGKRELSAGYRCVYEITAGVWNGLHYDAIQRKIRGNHLALVSEGRVGPDVAVYDHFAFTFDAKELEMANEPVEKTPGEGGGTGAMTLEQVVTMVSELAPQVAKLTEAFAKLSAPEEKAEGEIVEDKETAPAPAAAPAEAMDERVLIDRIAKRDALANKISQHVGTFDHSAMTLDDVVSYGCDRLGVKADKGQEAATLTGFLHGKTAATPAAVVAGQDAALPGDNFVTKHLTPKEG